jgi:hypothetical protein
VEVSSNSSSSTPTVTVTGFPSASRVSLRIALLAVAGYESLIGLEEFSEAFDLHDAPLSFGQFVINARLAIHPFFAIGALLLAALGYLRAAIIVLAAYILAAWLSDLPTIARFGYRVGLVAGRTIAIGSAADLSAACWGSDRFRLFGQTFMAWRAFRRPATGKSAFRDHHVYDRNHDLRILTAML